MLAVDATEARAAFECKHLPAKQYPLDDCRRRHGMRRGHQENLWDVPSDPQPHCSDERLHDENSQGKEDEEHVDALVHEGWGVGGVGGQTTRSHKYAQQHWELRLMCGYVLVSPLAVSPNPNVRHASTEVSQTLISSTQV